MTDRRLQDDDAVESTVVDIQKDATGLLEQVESVLQATDEGVPQQEELEALRETLDVVVDGADTAALTAHDDVLPGGFQ